MVYHLYPRASGSADGVNWLDVAPLPVSYQYVALKLYFNSN
jgi:hypothetical protein